MTQLINFGEMIQILRKEGWELNPNDKIVNSILKRIEMNNGMCPCYQEGSLTGRFCPCEEYRKNDICHCTLYVLKDEGKD